VAQEYFGFNCYVPHIGAHLRAGEPSIGANINQQYEAAMRTPSLQSSVSPEEWHLRVELAAAYRLAAMYGWTDLIYTHISVRVPGPEHQFLINPFGLMFDEITASNLVKVDQQGSLLSESSFPVNPAGFTIHSCIHDGRLDVGCVLHTHTRAGVAVSAQKCGILPISQQSTLVIPQLAYHDYEGVALREDEKQRLQADLGNKNFLMLRNHGLLTVGSTVAEAFVGMYVLESACQIQVSAQAGGELIIIDPTIMEGIPAVIDMTLKGEAANVTWSALLRKLDRADPSYKT
jgi:ribulose-5-phosphate 4-epimerase/fuculose-1-phosphate aldolase